MYACACAHVSCAIISPALAHKHLPCAHTHTHTPNLLVCQTCLLERRQRLTVTCAGLPLCCDMPLHFLLVLRCLQRELLVQLRHCRLEFAPLAPLRLHFALHPVHVSPAVCTLRRPRRQGCDITGTRCSCILIIVGMCVRHHLTPFAVSPFPPLPVPASRRWMIGGNTQSLVHPPAHSPNGLGLDTLIPSSVGFVRGVRGRGSRRQQSVAGSGRGPALALEVECVL